MSVPPDLILKIAQWKDSPAAMVRDLVGSVPEDWRHSLSTFEHAPVMAIGRDSDLVAWMVFHYMITHPYPKVVVASEYGDPLAGIIYARMVSMLDVYAALGALFQSRADRIFATGYQESWWTVFRKWRASDDAERQADSTMGFCADHLCMFLLDPPKLVAHAAHSCLESLRPEGRYVLVRA